MSRELKVATDEREPPPAVPSPPQKQSYIAAEELQRLVKSFHRCTSAFITRCYLLPLQCDGVERVHMDLFADVLRSIKQTITWVAANGSQTAGGGKKAITERDIVRVTGEPLRTIVTFWHREVVLALRDYKLSLTDGSHPPQPAQLDGKQMARKVVDLFLVDFEAWVSDVGGLLARWTSQLSRSQDKLSEAPTTTITTMTSPTSDPARKRAMSTPLINNNNNSTDTEPDETTLTRARPALPAINTLKQSPSLGTIMQSPRSPAVQEAVNAQSGSQNNQWDIDQMFKNLQQLRVQYEQDLARQVSRQQRKNSLAASILSNSKIIGPRKDTDETLAPRRNSDFKLTTQPLSGGGPKDPPRVTNSNLNDNNNNSNNRYSMSALRYTVATEASANASIVPSITSAAARQRSEGQLPHLMLHGSAHSSPALFSSSTPSESSTTHTNTAASQGGTGGRHHYVQHEFHKLTWLKDIKASLKSMFRRPSPSTPTNIHRRSASMGNIDDALRANVAAVRAGNSTSASVKRWKCQVCHDRLYQSGVKMQCAQCKLVVHEQCGRENDLGQWSCDGGK